jgi:hypothetical protein
LYDIPIGNRKIWEKLTYYGEEIRTLTYFLKIAYSTNNTIKIIVIFVHTMINILLVGFMNQNA